MKRGELIIDSFAGGGGASLGITWALGRCPDIAINHDAGALKMHAANHPDTHHVAEDVWKAHLKQLIKGRRVGLLWLSPDCKHHSVAKGGKPVEKGIRSLAWIACKWASEVQPRLIFLENVREFAFWCPLIPQLICPACGWKGTEGQARLMRIHRRCPECDSKRLKVTENMLPDPARKGLTFRRFIGRLKNLGYDVEYRNLDAADYGAPTHRRRLFLVARNDGAPIEWPEPTHGKPGKLQPSLFSSARKPWRTAAECIDWSIPCPSIFDRSKPLVDKTLRRIAHGIKRYVIDDPNPFIVPLTHGGERKNHHMDEPFPTITGAHRGELAIVTPVIAQLAHGEGPHGRWGKGSTSIEAPLGTIHAGGGNFALVAPTLIQAGYGERDGQAPRTLDLQQPLGTCVGTQKHALVAAFLAKHFGGMVGVGVDTPVPTTTMRGTQNQLVTANLVHLNHGGKQWSSMNDPMWTVMASGKHAALVFAFLTRFLGQSIGQSVNDPAPTAMMCNKTGLVVVIIQGDPYVIVDIGMRMLTPRELARAQGLPDTYILTGTKTNQVARIGNSVCPQVAAALVKANVASRKKSLQWN